MKQVKITMNAIHELIIDNNKFSHYFILISELFANTRRSGFRIIGIGKVDIEYTIRKFNYEYNTYI